MSKEFYSLKNEELAALTSTVLCDIFPKFYFEAVEFGDGTYKIRGVPKGSASIDSNILRYKITLVIIACSYMYHAMVKAYNLK